jgi:hypothetical protein
VGGFRSAARDVTGARQKAAESQAMVDRTPLVTAADDTVATPMEGAKRRHVGSSRRRVRL